VSIAVEAPRRAPRAAIATQLTRYSGLIALAALVVFFGIAVPDTFLTSLTFKSILGDQAIIGLVTLAALLPLVAGQIDLSVASVTGFSLCFTAWLQLHTGLPMAAIVFVALAACAGWGLLSALIVTRVGVDSFVATLGVGSVALGVTEAMTQGNTLTPGFPQGFADLGQGFVGPIPLTAVYLFAVALAFYFVLEWTPTGRRMLAVGGNPLAARLAGLRVAAIGATTLVVGALLAGLAGVVLAAKLGVATDSTAPGFLLPAIAAIFLGSTQLKLRVNVWGTLIAVYLLGTGTKGLQLMGASPWVNDFFNGAVLLVAVCLAVRKRAAKG
jgi:ribose transport system permease protein